MAVSVLCDQVCQCVATKCVAALPSPVSSAVEKPFMPHRSKASPPKMSAYALTNHPFNGLLPARLSAVTDAKIADKTGCGVSRVNGLGMANRTD
jgi:hypothetical protein